MLTSNYWGSVAFAWEQIYSALAIIMHDEFENYSSHISGDNELNVNIVPEYYSVVGSSV